MNRFTFSAATTALPGALRARTKPLALALALASACGGGTVSAPADAAAPPAAASFQFRAPPLAPARQASKTPSHTAATFVVTSCSDSGPGTLRDVIDNFAGDGDTIDMTQLTCGTITLGTGLVTSVNNLTIEGPGPTNLLLDGGDAVRPIAHLGTGTLALSNLSIWHGYAPAAGPYDNAGGGIASLGSVSLDGVSVKYCATATSGTGFARGGGVFAAGDFAASRSMIKYNDARTNQGYSRGGGVVAGGSASFDYATISGNQAFANIGFHSAGGAVLSYYGGALRQTTVSGNEAAGAGGVVFLNGHIAISQSTISGNSSTYSFIGSGAHVQSVFPVLVENSTITGNVESNPSFDWYGAGLHLAPATSASVVSTIISGNRFDDGTGVLWYSDINGGAGATLTGDHDLFGWSGIPVPADTFETDDPGLGPLADNGGPTLTHALRPTSPAINAGNNITGVPVDQRGTGFPRVIGIGADIGAFESDGDAIFANGFD